MLWYCSFNRMEILNYYSNDHSISMGNGIFTPTHLRKQFCPIYCISVKYVSQFFSLLLGPNGFVFTFHLKHLTSVCACPLRGFAEKVLRILSRAAHTVGLKHIKWLNPGSAKQKCCRAHSWMKSKSYFLTIRLNDRWSTHTHTHTHSPRQSHGYRKRKNYHWEHRVDKQSQPQRRCRRIVSVIESKVYWRNLCLQFSEPQSDL